MARRNFANSLESKLDNSADKLTITLRLATDSTMNYIQSATLNV